MADTTSGHDEGAVLDRAMFDDFASLFDAAELRDVVEQWHDDSSSALDTITDALERDDRAVIADVAHRAAGGGLALGAAAFAAACQRLRATAESGAAVTDADVAPVRSAVSATYEAMKRAAAELGG